MFTVAGLILLLAGSSWFAGAHTVGVITLIIGILFEVMPCLVVLGSAMFDGL